MSTDRSLLTVAGIEVELVRRPIKNLHVGVYPPHGRVRVAAPPYVSEAAVRVAIVTRLAWIRRHRAGYSKQVREEPRALVSGESHYYRGRRYRLAVVEAEGRSEVVLRGGWLVLNVPPGSSAAERALALDRWYRRRLRELVTPLVAQWQERLGVRVAAWGIKRMKTKWGSCNPAAGRLWLNLELVKKSPAALEYLVVHELAHLRVKNHGPRFAALMDQHLPSWTAHRAALNAAPLAAWR